MQNTEKIFLACNPEMEERFMQKNEERRHKLNYIKDIKDADCIMLVDGTEGYNEYIKTADELGISIVYLDEQGRNKALYEALLSNSKEVVVKR